MNRVRAARCCVFLESTESRLQYLNTALQVTGLGGGIFRRQGRLRVQLTFGRRGRLKLFTNSEEQLCRSLNRFVIRDGVGIIK